MRDEILEFLRKNKGSFTSGQSMSEACQVSRTAVWKHIEVLRSKGYKIESFTKRGYRLLEEPDLVSPLEMEDILTTETFGRTYEYIERTESTNREARRLAEEGTPEGTVVITEEQCSWTGTFGIAAGSPYAKGLWLQRCVTPDLSAY